jgi:hypothetical protein
LSDWLKEDIIIVSHDVSLKYMINFNSKNVNIKCSAYVNILLSVSSDDFDIVVSKMKIDGLEN